jgi:hypothetical protein
MKIQVVRCDGRAEILDLLGTLKVTEPAPDGQGTLMVEETGTIYFFRSGDGCYDGWGQDMVGLELSEQDAVKFVDAVEKQRTILDSGKVEQRGS